MKTSIDEQFAEDRKQLREKQAEWLKHKDALLPVVLELEKLGIQPRWRWSLDLYFSGDAAKLAAVVRVLRTRGWKTDAERPGSMATGWTGWFNHPECKAMIWLNFVSSVCRKVQVGTRVVEEPVYEIRCGEAAEPSPAADSSTA